jgi:uncharacterized protein
VDVGGGWGGITLAHNVRSPEEVDAVIEEARGAGGAILREPEKAFWGGYSAVFADPDRHPREIAHNPRWTLHERVAWRDQPRRTPWRTADEVAPD